MADKLHNGVVTTIRTNFGFDGSCNTADEFVVVVDLDGRWMPKYGHAVVSDNYYFFIQCW